MKFRRLPEIRILVAIVFFFISLILRELVMSPLASVLSLQGKVSGIWLGPGSGPADNQINRGVPKHELRLVIGAEDHNL